MNVNAVVAFLKIHSLSSEECNEVMNALCRQEEVLTGNIVTRDYFRSMVKDAYNEIGVSDEKLIQGTERKAEENFMEYMRYGLEGSTSDIIETSIDEAVLKAIRSRRKGE